MKLMFIFYRFQQRTSVVLPLKLWSLVIKSHFIFRQKCQLFMLNSLNITTQMERTFLVRLFFRAEPLILCVTFTSMKLILIPGWQLEIGNSFLKWKEHKTAPFPQCLLLANSYKHVFFINMFFETENTAFLSRPKFFTLQHACIISAVTLSSCIKEPNGYMKELKPLQ